MPTMLTYFMSMTSLYNPNDCWLTCPRATVTVLYRPYVLSGVSALPFEAQPSWQKTVLEQARAAASNTNSVLEKIIEFNFVHLLKPMM